MIAELELSDLVPGSLARLFNAGHLAVLVRCPDVIATLWHDLLENPDEQMPWELPLLDIARNYRGCADITASLGDLFYFQPGRHGYIARKMALSCSDGEDEVKAQPRSFVQGPQSYSPAQQVLDRCWSIGRQLMAALTPDGTQSAPFSVAVQRLKYQANANDIDRMEALACNSLGRWGRAGCVLDAEREKAAGILSPRWLSDIYGMLAHVPVAGQLVRWINTRLQRRDPRRIIGPDQRLIEAPHSDHRYFTALCGRRERIVTQIFNGAEWVELPVDLKKIAVFPGTLAKQAYGLLPVAHRVLHVGDTEGSEGSEARMENVTLMIGAS